MVKNLKSKWANYWIFLSQLFLFLALFWNYHSKSVSESNMLWIASGFLVFSALVLWIRILKK